MTTHYSKGGTVVKVTSVTPAPASPSDEEDSTTDDVETDAPETDEFDTESATVNELIKYAEEHPDEVEDLLAAEKAGKARKGAVTGLEELLGD